MDRHEDDPRPATVSVHDMANGMVVVSADGEIDQLTAPRLAEAIDGALASASTVLVDLAAVRFFASAGLSVLVQAANRAQQDSRQLRVVASDDVVLRPLALTGLDAVISVHATRDEALRDLPG